MTLLAAFHALLARVSGQEDLCLGTPVAGRTRAETEELIGLFVNTLVLRLDLSGDPPFRELVGRARRTCLDAYAHQDLPFDKLVEALRPERSDNNPPLFQTLIAVQSSSTALALPGLAVEPIPIDNGAAILELSLFLTGSGSGLSGALEYDRDLFDTATIRRFASRFETLLRSLAAQPDLRLSELPLLSEAERAHILDARREPVPTGEPGESSRAPRDDVEVQLVSLWSDILGTPVAVTADFFALGGHSLLAMRLFARIEETFGRRLPVTTLFRAPTIARLADLLRAPVAAGAEALLVPIQPQGSRPPILWVRSLLKLRRLACRLGPEQPSYGLRVHGVDHLRPPYSLGDIAREDVAEIVAFRPQGPYLLAGWCLAGILAFEIAQQLHARGEEVTWLILFDAPCPWSAARAHSGSGPGFGGHAAGRRLAFHTRHLLKLAQGERAAYFRDRAHSFWKYHVATPFWRVLYGLDLDGGRLARRRADPDLALRLAAHAYSPSSFPGRIALVQAQDRSGAAGGEERERWAELAQGRLHVIDVPGDHETMFEDPYVGVTAGALADCLELGDSSLCSVSALP
jgi:thioesterase domain-containing protein/acyl carrier protein